MNSRRALAWTTALLLLAWPSLGPSQPMTSHMDGMGGGRRATINLVSPAASPVQIARGMVTLSRTSSAAEPGSTMMGGMTPGLLVRLVLYGVADGNGVVSSTGNHFKLDAQLTSASEPPTAVSLDEPFAIANGFALLTARLPLPSAQGRATLLVDSVSVTDAAGAVVAQTGVQVTLPSPRTTPAVTPTPATGASCLHDSDCDDGNPSTQDFCRPVGCMHMPEHDGPGMMH